MEKVGCYCGETEDQANIIILTAFLQCNLQKTDLYMLRVLFDDF